MALLSKHVISATVPGVTSIVTPAYDEWVQPLTKYIENWNVTPVYVPEVPFYADGFESGLASWTVAGDAAISNATDYVRSGTKALGLNVILTDTDTQRAVSTLSGLTIGKSYTFTAWSKQITGAGTFQRIGVTGIGWGATTSKSYSDPWFQNTYTFTATATSHQLVLESSGNYLISNSRWDDIEVVESGYWAEDGLEGWTPGTNMALANMDGGRSGRALQVTATNTWTSGAMASYTRSGLTSGLAHTLTAWVYTPTGRTLRMHISGKTATTATAVPAGVWTQLTYTFTSSATSHDVQLVGVGGSSGAVVLLDDVKLVRDLYSIPHAAVTANPAILNVTEATLTLDDSWAPYCQAVLTMPYPDATALDGIDPRDSSTNLRVNITLSEEYSDWNSFGYRSTDYRTFDLRLANRQVSYDGKTMKLFLESDESLLRYYTLNSTASQRTNGLSVQTAVEFALGKIGAALYLGTRTNRHTNPNTTTTTGFTSANGATVTLNSGKIRAVTGTSASAGITITAAAVTASSTYTYSFDLTAVSAGSYSISVQGATVSGGSSTVSRTFTAGETYRMFVTVPHIAAGTPAFYAVRNGTTNLTFEITNILIQQGSATEFFSGSTPSDQDWTYSWNGAANNSSSAAKVTQSDATLPYTEGLMGTNLCTNPSGEVDTSGWTGIPGTTGVVALTSATTTSFQGTKSIRATWSTASTAAGGGLYFDIPVEAGKAYSFQFNRVLSSITNRLRIRLGWRSASEEVGATGGTAIVVTGGTAYTTDVAFRLSNRVAPEFATVARVSVESQAGTSYANWSVSSYLQVDALMAVQGSVAPTYFDGDTTNTATTIYRWTGTAGASRSEWVNIADTDATIWYPGVSAWEFISPLVQATGLRLYCDEQRRWRLLPATQLQDGIVTLGAAQNVTDATDTISLQDSTEFFKGVNIRWVDPRAEVADVYEAAGVSLGAKAFTYNRTYPGPGAAAYILARAAGKGRQFDLEAASDYMVTPGMTLVATLPDIPIQSGVVSSVTWNFPDASMAVKSRGLTDTPLRSWVLDPAGVAWSDVAVGIDWTEDL